ncbi:5-formyltetrahydrofolate cyclo-ligase [Streptomyces iconiensis]|uniref:5-formyltetrahydrofolate cyclo-ligase n=1 Tax=Streptomyces iconiensis TaxID=1384038 RepID=A0ABT7A584_9ACTN|nr:5-formyltetrahydrofolate cyclo-ligase [Streptomyces iconiensis]MDJ1136441.1 5-formyltetrahydrofolate cyclo-ligase [Streptomyces iconiensis]
MRETKAVDQRSKWELRRDVLAVRARLSPNDLLAHAQALTRRVLELPELTSATSVAAYVSVGTEPGTGPLLDALRHRGVHLLLPVLRPDNDLDWAEYEGSHALAPAGRGLLEPSGARLGPDAVTQADAVLLPGLAVDARGLRLGRGAGCYDRVLTRLATARREPARAVLLYDTELVERVPSEEHDRAVGLAVTPGAVHRFGAEES